MPDFFLPYELPDPSPAPKKTQYTQNIKHLRGEEEEEAS
jgi:hypothetical protein